MLVDLHSHSYYSDGIYSPTDVVNMAKNSNCDLFALTDHDSIDGIVEAQNRANKIGVNFVNGVEISAMWNNMTVHIIALGVDINNQTLQQGLRKHQELREIRAKKMAFSLQAAGIDDALEKTKKLVKKNMVTRTHFARMLVENGICKNTSSVFKRYLTNKKPGFVKVEWSSIYDVINWINISGGLSVLAHPLRYRMTNSKLKKLLIDFKLNGGNGIEVITSGSKINEINLISTLAKELNLLLSIGSDFHGDNDYIKIGKLQSINADNVIWNKL